MVRKNEKTRLVGGGVSVPHRVLIIALNPGQSKKPGIERPAMRLPLDPKPLLSHPRIEESRRLTCAALIFRVPSIRLAHLSRLHIVSSEMTVSGRRLILRSGAQYQVIAGPVGFEPTVSELLHFSFGGQP